MTLVLELALVTKLKALAEPVSNVFDGVTTREQRMERVRVAVKRRADVVYTVENGRIVTMAQAFTRAYGEDLWEDA